MTTSDHRAELRAGNRHSSRPGETVTGCRLNRRGYNLLTPRRRRGMDIRHMPFVRRFRRSALVCDKWWIFSTWQAGATRCLMDNEDYPQDRVEAVGGQNDWAQLHPLET